MIKTIIVDCDGCLTDGKKHIDADGRRSHITFHSRDNIAARRFQAMGIRVIVITASAFQGIRKYWGKYNIEVYTALDKLETLNELEIDFETAIGIGDDVIDFKFLEECKWAYVPADAHPSLLRRFQALNTRGGDGVLAELYHRLGENKYNPKNFTVAW